MVVFPAPERPAEGGAGGRGRREKRGRGREGGVEGRGREGETVKEKWKNEGLEETEEGQRGKEGVGTKEAWVLLVTVPT